MPNREGPQQAGIQIDCTLPNTLQTLVVVMAETVADGCWQSVMLWQAVATLTLYNLYNPSQTPVFLINQSTIHILDDDPLGMKKQQRFCSKNQQVCTEQ